MSLPCSVFLRSNTFHPYKKLAETRLVGEVEALCDGGDAVVGASQKPNGLHQQHLVDVTDDGAPRHLADDARQMGGCDT